MFVPGYRLLQMANSGHFHHDPDDDRVEYDVAGVFVYDTWAYAEFENPYDEEEHNFDFGFLLRVNRDGSPLIFRIHSNGTWEIEVLGQFEYSGNATSLRDSDNDVNTLSVTVLGEWISARLNGEDITNSEGHNEFHIGTTTSAGDVRIATGLWYESERSGAITHYDSFSVWEILPARSTDSTAGTRQALERISRSGGPLDEAVPSTSQR